MQKNTWYLVLVLVPIVLVASDKNFKPSYNVIDFEDSIDFDKKNKPKKHGGIKESVLPFYERNDYARNDSSSLLSFTEDDLKKEFQELVVQDEKEPNGTETHNGTEVVGCNKCETLEKRYNNLVYALKALGGILKAQEILIKNLRERLDKNDKEIEDLQKKEVEQTLKSSKKQKSKKF